MVNAYRLEKGAFSKQVNTYLSCLALKKTPTFDGVEFTDLGKINILCGKNNSGKTTLLTTLKVSTACKIGRKFSPEDFAELHTQTTRKMKWPKTNETFHKFYLELLQEISEEQSGRVWYSGESKDFIKLIIAKQKKHVHLRRFPVLHDPVEKAFSSFYCSYPSTVFVPPKRQLNLSSPIKTNEEIGSEGIGILNYLFFSKSQEKRDPNYKFYARLQDAFSRISNGFKFFVKLDPQRNNTISLTFSYKDGPLIQANQCGLGLQDLLVILFFSLHPNDKFVLIEEPESHIHPDMQRRLLHVLKEIPGKQFVLTTHSNIFLNSSLVDQVFYVYYEKGIKVDNATSRASILYDLGYSVVDNLVADLVILTEGPTDKPVLEELLLKKGLSKEYDIKFWPLGGDIMDQLDLSVFQEKKKIIALIDRDPQSDKVRTRFTKKCDENGISVRKLERYALENYFTLDALRSVFGSQINESITEIDPNRRIGDQIGLDPKKNNRKIAQAMTLEDISGTDLERFLDDVEKMCKE